MSTNTTRRDFVKTTAAVGAGFWVAGGVAPRPTYASSLDRVQFACIGIGGKGSSDSADAARTGDVVAVCDIDETTLEGSHPGAKQFFDYREMLDEMGDQIDAVTVSTPDHTHAVAALAAMRMGKHCFCQKPLTHSIEEARLLGDVARENNLVTQMGNQGTAGSILRKSAALIQHGHIGEVQHVHVWTNRPVWPQGIDIEVKEGPDDNDQDRAAWEQRVAEVHWDEWIGPAAKRPYSPEIHPFKWRGFWDFGTGALGDMACHTLNMAFMALNLRNPTSVSAVSSGHDQVMYPKWSQIEFEFPELNGRPALGMTWYDGGKMPPAALIRDLPRYRDGDKQVVYSSAALVVGTEGMLFSPGDYGGDEQGNTGIMRPDGTYEKQRRIDTPSDFFVPSPGHFDEFTNAIQGDGAPVSNFPDYAGPLTETILLGNLAVWAASEDKIEWNAEDMEFSNVPLESVDSVEQMVRHQYHNDYSIHEMAGADN
ncbi:MAG: Gfo/Idh/MocA family protein [Pirellulaceae bacterium]